MCVCVCVCVWCALGWLQALCPSPCSVDSTTKEASFTIGLQGIKEEDVERVRNIVWNTLEKVARYSGQAPLWRGGGIGCHDN